MQIENMVYCEISLNFTYNNVQYRYMGISQIDLLDYYRNKADGSYPLGTVFAVFSLTFQNSFNILSIIFRCKLRIWYTANI